MLTFWYGLAQVPAEQQVIDLATGNFNTFMFRLFALVTVSLLQAHLMLNFITFHLKRQRENANAQAAAAVSTSTRSKKTQQEKAKLRKEQKPKKEKMEDSPGNEENENELPEVDQNTKKTLRQRK